uniref:Secreted protein n=1 Tax=Ixodes ricinus TaxID=34613 RepID=A0A6B0TZW2_IXORI
MSGSVTWTWTWCTTLTCGHGPCAKGSATSCCPGRRGGCGLRKSASCRPAAGPSSPSGSCGLPWQTRSRSPDRRTVPCPGRTWRLPHP